LDYGSPREALDPAEEAVASAFLSQ
jgi:hypothetical protein